MKFVYMQTVSTNWSASSLMEQKAAIGTAALMASQINADRSRKNKSSKGRIKYLKQALTPN